MITPRFTITQSDAALTVTIYAPFTNVADTEVFMEECDFRFFSKPYFLRLHLPGEVHETDDAAAKYDADTRSFVVTVPKKNKGEDFVGLDMLTELLRPRADAAAAAGGAGIEEVGGYAAPGEEDEDEIDWYFEQQLPETAADGPAVAGGDGYGFAFSQTGVFSRLREEAAEILDVKNPDELTAAQRREVRREMESACFDSDHYLCDLFESDEVLRLAGNKSLWQKVLDGEEAAVALSDGDREKMLALPKREFLVAKGDLNAVYFGLVDILFGCCYDARVNEGERCAESAWNVAKLSPTLSCCERHDSLPACVAASLRRSLCFPLFRHFGLSAAALRDVAAVLRLGRTAVVKQLLEATACMAADGRHVLNQLYLEPYAAWVQRGAGERRLWSLAEAVEAECARVGKADLELELVEVEEAARLTLAEEEEVEVARRLQGMDIRVAEGDSDDDSSSSGSSSESSSSSSSDDEDDGKEVESEKASD